MIFAGVADDFSGGNDLAGRLAGLGLKAYVSRNLDESGLAGARQAQALILNAQTRLLGPSEAKAATAKAWQALLSRELVRAAI